MKKLIFTLCGMFFTSLYGAQEVKTNTVSDSAKLHQELASVLPKPNTDAFIKCIKPKQKQAAAVDRHVTYGYLEALTYTNANTFRFLRCRSTDTLGLIILFKHLILSDKENIKIIITGEEPDWSNDELFAIAFCLTISPSVTKINIAGFDASTPEAKERFKEITSSALRDIYEMRKEDLYCESHIVRMYCELAVKMEDITPYADEYAAYLVGLMVKRQYSTKN